MRTIVALSLFVALCAAEIAPESSTDLEILRYRVRNMKWNVETAVRRLELLRFEAEDDTLRQVSSKWDEEQDSHRTYKTLLLSGIRSEVEAAKAEGKDVNSCLQEAVDGVKNNQGVAYDDATKCGDTAQNSIHNSLGFIDNLISAAKTLLTELDNIFLNCHDSDIYRMQFCIITELTKMEGALDTMERDSVTAEITIAPVSKNVVMQASNCIKQAYSITYSAGAAIRMRVTQCIATALTTTTTTTLAPTTTLP